ncbi:MAG: drug:proton antiporter [Hyphomicrobiales bacterium]|nr:MAG: drug:proton antiporter [Hyphomicrobiales bacterium]
MTTPNQILNYVADPAVSAALYSKILGRAPVSASPAFAMFALDNGTILAFWSRDEVEPRATLPGGSELGFPMPDDAAVAKTHADWVKLGLRIIQQPVQMPFGYTFTAADPDGHRLRVFNPAPAP